eukprot:3452931-Lingulodinium_polyedra.AAC.1
MRCERLAGANAARACGSTVSRVLWGEGAGERLAAAQLRLGVASLHSSHELRCLAKAGVLLVLCQVCGGFCTGLAAPLLHGPCGGPEARSPARLYTLRRALRGDWPTTALAKRWGGGAMDSGAFRLGPAVGFREVSGHPGWLEAVALRAVQEGEL